MCSCLGEYHISNLESQPCELSCVGEYHISNLESQPSVVVLVSITLAI